MQDESKDTQNAQIRAALLNGKRITPLSALNDFGCFRLSARIFDLRNDYGMNIEMMRDPVKHYATYWMRTEEIAKHV